MRVARALVLVLCAFLFVVSGVFAEPSTNPADYFFYDDVNGVDMTDSWGSINVGAYSTTVPYPGGTKSIQVNNSGGVSLVNVISSSNFTSAEYTNPYCIAYGYYFDSAPANNQESGIMLGGWATAVVNRNSAASTANMTNINESAYTSFGPALEDTWQNVTVCFTQGYAGSGETNMLLLYNDRNTFNSTTLRSRLSSIGLHNRQGAGEIAYFGPVRIWNYTAYNTTGPQAGSAPSFNVITVTLSNNVTGAGLGSLTFANVTGSLTFSYFNITASGFCTSYSGNGTGTNCTSSGSGSSTFFNVSTSQAITGTEGVTTSAYQSLLSINATMLYTLAPIGVFNISNGLNTNVTSSGTLSIPGVSGSNNVMIRVGGNYSLNATCTGVSLATSTCTVGGVYDDLFKVNATDALNGAPVLNFTVQVLNSTLGGNILNASTTNGSVFLPVLQGYDYTFLMDANGYAYQNATAMGNASTNVYTFILLPSNSLFLTFYDQTTLALLDYENVTVVFSNGTFSFQNSTNTSEMIASNLAPGTWTITASAPSYESSQYFVTVTARSSQALDVYLFNSTLTGETTITIKDANTADVISGATVTLQIEVGGNWVTFDQQVSDVFGVTFFDLVQGEEYQMIVEATGYSTKTGVFVRTASSYIVPLLSANTQDFTSFLDDFTYVTSPEYVGLNSTTFSITTSSPDGRLEWFSVTVMLNGTNTTSNVTGSPSGGTASVTLNLSAYPGHTVVAVYRVKSTSFDDPLEVSRSWYISGLVGGNYTFTSFMEYYAEDENGLGFGARGIVLTIVAVLLALAVGAFFGLEAGVVIAAVVFLAGSFYGWMHWSVTIVVVCALIGTLLMKGGRL